jgi:hypothetical protein
VTAVPVVDLDNALGISRDGQGIVTHTPKHRFTKTKFPSQGVNVLGKKVLFRIPKQNDPNTAGAPVGIFETDDDELAQNIRSLIATAETPLFIQYERL